VRPVAGKGPLQERIAEIKQLGMFNDDPNLLETCSSLPGSATKCGALERNERLFRCLNIHSWQHRL
jgi:hypothetical protein